jgi:FtsP/CotA-like multicopper oxidase with cupredoxin domain
MNDVNKNRRGPFKRKQVAAAVAAAVLYQLATNEALANAGFGSNTDINGNAINVPTYFQTSPSGVHPAFDTTTHTFSLTTFTTSAPSATPNAATAVSISVMPPIVESSASIDSTGLIVSVASTANLVAGDTVFGGGFAKGTKIVSITSATTFTTSAAGTASATGVSLWIIPNPGTVLQSNANIDATGKIVSAASSFVPVVGALVTGGGFPDGTTITAITGQPVTADSGAPLRKFVDNLGGAYNGLETLSSLTDLQSGMPVAIPESNWKNPFNGVQTGDDYYEIAVVEYTERLHSDMAKPTRLRGYVQIETANIVNNGLKDVAGIGSEHVPGVYPDGSPILDASGKQVYFVHKPHYLGPAIIATRGKAVRIKYTNYLPYTDSTGKSVGSWNGTGGELPLPIDETIPGGGAVLDAGGKQIYAKNAAGQPILDAAGNPVPIKMGQNRVSIHWHGGDTPWTNDGTPHQWFAPAGDIAYTLGIDPRHPYGMGKGESTTGQSVPDMPDPGPGSYNLYFPNNLTGRLMMYHDHASGLTRPNAYIGNAAGYIVVDPTELTLASNAIGEPLSQTSGGLPTGLLDSVGIPLVVQDKTFVPKNVGPAAVASDGKTPASQDARWDLGHWGQPGDLFFPHVYETNQDPNSIDGTNPVGRWDWGPWFWPVFPAQYSLPTGAYGDVTTTPEAFLDTPTVNGQLYPTMTVDPKTYRFRILSIGNDRSFNLGLYQAVDANGVVCDANNANPAVPPRSPGDVSAAGPATCTEVRMVPASPTPGFPATWPTDGRGGGVPDPATAGPDIVQIGNEAGLLPAVAVWKSQPIVYEQNVRSITVFNVLNHDLLLMGAERGDVLIDFSNYAGQTLIMYNDAPAPLPGFDPRIDYYTGDGDQTGAGGAYNTLAGYGPNTRTVMQFKVNKTNTSGTGGALNVAALQAALPAAYAATQAAPLIPEKAYDAAFGTTSSDNYASIGTGSGAKPTFFVNGATTLTLTPPVVRNGGSGYPAGATVTFSAPQTAGGVTATATPTIDPVSGAITGFTNFNAGSGYTAMPTIALSAPAANGAIAQIDPQATGGYAVINKAIQELFDPVYGRMNATLAAELPFSTATVATTIPLAYVDTPIDYLDGIKEGETQIWKITHNGVDSHPVHFHLVNVQVINRVGWDGVIKPPAPNEVGWRETLRMNPLEDVYVAVRAAKPVTPFGLPTSQRLLDPSQAVGGGLGFTNIDPTTGNAPTIQTYLVNGVSKAMAVAGTYTNQVTDFDNEYVWHCHILGHEEFDFMRPFVFHPNVIVPDAPAQVAVSGSTVTWLDPTPYGGQDAQGIPTAGVNAAYPTPTSSPKNEIGFNVLVNGVQVNTAAIPANSTSWTAPAGTSLAGTVTVVAYNAAGTSLPGTATTTTAASTTVTAPAATQAPGTQGVTATIDATGLNVTLSAAPATPLVVGASVSGGGFPQGTTIATITSATTFATSVASTTPGVTGVALTISLAAAAPLPVQPAAAAPSGLTQTLNANGTVTLSWTAVPGATGYTVSTVETASTGTVTTTTATATAATYTTGVLNAGSTYSFSVTATTLSGTTTAATTGLGNSVALAPVAFGGAADATPGNITLTWANNASNKNNVAGLLLTWTPAGGATVSHTFAATTTGVTLTGLTSGAAYAFTLQAVSSVVSLSSATLSTFASGASASVTAP